jgi:C1A family cysteine protease
MTSKHVYNRKPDTLDGTEQNFGVEHHIMSASALPSMYDLRTVSKCVPAILDQGQIGDCLGNETSNAMRFCLAKENNPVFQPSRLMLYYFGRMMDKSPLNQDTGMSYTGCFKGVQKYGVCSENNWGYDVTKFAIQPPAPALTAGISHIKGFGYLQVPQDIMHIKQAIVSGFPVLIGIAVYSSFESDSVAKTGIVPMPNVKNEQCLGGHSVQIWGYNDATQSFILSNSWGTGWGQQGYFTLSYKYVLDPNLCDSLWSVRYFK